MIRPDGSELVVRAVALYGPILAVICLALYRRPDRRRAAAAVVATAWNLPTLLALNVVAVHFGWWSFGSHTATVAGVPADAWIGWALLWGAVPLLSTARTGVVAAGLVVLDLVLMPLGEPVLLLHSTWIVGELVAVATCLAPAVLLGRWTVRDTSVHRRVALQVGAFGGLLAYVVPSLAFAAIGGSWSALLERPRWHFVLAVVLLAPIAAATAQAVREFADHGGTPVPLDPPTTLVVTGPYAFVANPMQLGVTLLLASWGVLIASPVVVATAAVAAAFSAGVASWSEKGDLHQRFGDEWVQYREHVHSWIPRWRPWIERPAAVYVAETCPTCSQVGDFIQRRATIGLTVLPAEASKVGMKRITYRSGGDDSTGVAALGRSLEHVNLAWATVSWIGRLPGIEALLQTVTDAIGGEPRSLSPVTASGDTSG